MSSGIRLKVCGITTAGDAAAAAAAGAEWLGFIFHPQSPRHLAPAQYAALRPELPKVRRVAVCVEPTPVELARLDALGFDFFQVHFRVDLPRPQIGSWTATVGGERLWLAPKLPPELDLAADLLPFAETFLLDTYHADKFGGTGATGDWEKFRRQQAARPDKSWVLSGGLSPDNLEAAIAASGARWIDLSSGVESAPGLKDPAKLQRLAQVVKTAVG